MIRAPLVCLKHICCALLALASFLCALEVGLRLYVAQTEHLLAGPDAEHELQTSSWLTQSLAMMAWGIPTRAMSGAASGL